MLWTDEMGGTQYSKADLQCSRHWYVVGLLSAQAIAKKACIVENQSNYGDSLCLRIP